MNIVLFHVFEVTAPEKIPSVNSMYKPKSSFRKAYAWLYKDAKVEKFQQLLVEQATLSELVKAIDYKDSVDYVDITYIFLLNKNFFKRDVTNMIKMTEDALMSVTQIDDSKHRRVSAFKALSHIPEKEYIICKYEITLNEDKQ